MQLTQGASFAFHALMQMVREPDRVMTIEAMSESLGASPSYMAKLFQRLARAGLVTSRRGRGGGYALARPCQEITLWDIVDALQEESLAEAPLLPACPTCVLAGHCPMHGAVQAAIRQVEKQLRTVSLEGMASLVDKASSTGAELGSGISLRPRPGGKRIIAGSASRR